MPGIEIGPQQRKLFARGFRFTSARMRSVLRFRQTLLAARRREFPGHDAHETQAEQPSHAGR